MKTLIINHKIKNCGVYQYGLRFGSILEKSKNNNFIYLEIDSGEEFFHHLDKHNPDCIIYNFVDGTMNWMGVGIFNHVKFRGIKQGLVVHNGGNNNYFDFFLHQNPFYVENGNNYSVLRPLFDFEPKENLQNETIKIGTFGFGFACKYFDNLCEMVNEQFREDNVELRIHTTHAYFASGGNGDFINYISEVCRSKITNQNIKLNITTDFISNEEMLEFLSGNDLNIFLYERFPSYNGISSSIDYALSVEKPIAINQSNMFSHIWDVEPSILIEKNGLKEIIKNGFAPLKTRKDSWSNENFINHIERILTEIK